MAIRIRIPQQDRAKQFASFDALKGLQQSLRLEEYKHNMIVKGDIQEEKANEISTTLLHLRKGDKPKPPTTKMDTILKQQAQQN